MTTRRYDLRRYSNSTISTTQVETISGRNLTRSRRYNKLFVNNELDTYDDSSRLNAKELSRYSDDKQRHEVKSKRHHVTGNVKHSTAKHDKVTHYRSDVQGTNIKSKKKHTHTQSHSETRKKCITFKAQKVGKEEQRRAEKTTYCRPISGKSDRELLLKALENKKKLQNIVHKLAEAREKEKHKQAWREYINKLKLKHGAFASSAKSMPSTSKIPYDIKTIYNTKITPTTLRNHKTILNDLYKSSSDQTEKIRLSRLHNAVYDLEALEVSPFHTHPYPDGDMVNNKKYIQEDVSPYFSCHNGSLNFGNYQTYFSVDDDKKNLKCIPECVRQCNNTFGPSKGRLSIIKVPVINSVKLEKPQYNTSANKKKKPLPVSTPTTRHYNSNNLAGRPDADKRYKTNQYKQNINQYKRNRNNQNQQNNRNLRMNDKLYVDQDYLEKIEGKIDKLYDTVKLLITNSETGGDLKTLKFEDSGQKRKPCNIITCNNPGCTVQNISSKLGNITENGRPTTAPLTPDYEENILSGMPELKGDGKKNKKVKCECGCETMKDKHNKVENKMMGEGYVTKNNNNKQSIKPNVKCECGCETEEFKNYDKIINQDEMEQIRTASLPRYLEKQPVISDYKKDTRKFNTRLSKENALKTREKGQSPLRNTSRPKYDQQQNKIKSKQEQVVTDDNPFHLDESKRQVQEHLIDRPARPEPTLSDAWTKQRSKNGSILVKVPSPEKKQKLPSKLITHPTEPEEKFSGPNIENSFKDESLQIRAPSQENVIAFKSTWYPEEGPNYSDEEDSMEHHNSEQRFKEKPKVRKIIEIPYDEEMRNRIQSLTSSSRLQLPPVVFSETIDVSKRREYILNQKPNDKPSEEKIIRNKNEEQSGTNFDGENIPSQKDLGSSPNSSTKWYRKVSYESDSLKNKKERTKYASMSRDQNISSGFFPEENRWFDKDIELNDIERQCKIEKMQDEGYRCEAARLREEEEDKIFMMIEKRRREKERAKKYEDVSSITDTEKRWLESERIRRAKQRQKELEQSSEPDSEEQSPQEGDRQVRMKQNNWVSSCYTFRNLKTQLKGILAENRSSSLSGSESPVSYRDRQKSSTIWKNKGTNNNTTQNDKYVCAVVTEQSGHTTGSGFYSASSKMKIQDILNEEINKSNKAKKDIEEILNGEPPRRCNVAITLNVPIKERCTEVTDSLSQADVSDERFPLVPVRSTKRLTIAVNTDPLSLLALLEISKATIRRMLTYVQFNCHSLLPLPTQMQPIEWESNNSKKSRINRTRGDTQIVNQVLTHSPDSTRDCCVCRHLMARSQSKGYKPCVGVFQCHYCDKCFTRSYCRELHELKCAREHGKQHDVPDNLSFLT